MLYIVEYEVCALIFLIVVATHYFSKRRFPNLQNSMFSVILVLALLDLVLDIGGSVTVSHASIIPAWVNMVINMAFYAIQISLPVSLVLYTLTLAGRYSRKNFPRLFLIVLPALMQLCVLLTNPLTHVYFYLDPALGYVHGPWFESLYVSSIYYLAMAVYVALKYRGRIPSNQVATILAFVLACVLGVIIQYFFPKALLTGMVIALSITMMYLTMQNPGDMLDSLTGVFNRQAMIRLIQDNIEDKRDFSVIGVEIDDMHRINTLFSEKAGNELLQQIGLFFSNMVGNDWIFRMMGNRFVMVTDGRERYEPLLSAIRERFSDTFRISGVDIPLAYTIVSIPETAFLPSAEEVEHLLEVGFPMANRPGGGGEAVIDDAVIERLKRKQAVEEALRRALDSDGFTLALQPIYSLESGRFPSAEALARLTDPVLGVISPAEFIPIAEQNGMVTSIDEMMMRKVCRFVMKHHPQHRLGVSGITVNLSAVSLMQSDLPERIFTVFAEEGMKPGFVNIEVTESAAIRSEEQVLRCIDSLRAGGIRLLLDDFGTGYANIARIAHLPLYAVKLDKSMLEAYDESLKSAIIFENTITLCRSLGLFTVVEGVEKNGQVEIARAVRADFVQGFHLAAPMSEEAYVAFLQEKNNGGTG